MPEIYAYGFRNPYRFAFDTANGDLIMADVGQNNIEEINRVTLGGNYGWAVKEGTFLFNRTQRHHRRRRTVGDNSPGVPAGLIDPISGTMGTLRIRPRRRHLDHRRLRVPRHRDSGAGRQVCLRRPGACGAVRRVPMAGCFTPTCRPG